MQPFIFQTQETVEAFNSDVLRKKEKNFAQNLDINKFGFGTHTCDPDGGPCDHD